ncbi:MAG: ABC transporter permease [Sphingobium sp.]
MIGLALAYLCDRAFTTALNILLLAIASAMLMLLVQFGTQLSENLQRGTANIDLVVGAKGSPLQLILSSIYHVDEPTGNIPLSAMKRLQHDPGVASLTPLALGDNFDGYRIVGTDQSFLSLYGAGIAQGRSFSAPSEAVMGATVARNTGAKLGQKFVGSHGLAESEGEEHEHAPLTVTGILTPTGTVADRLILTSVETVWDVHGIEHHHEHGSGHEGDTHDEHEHAHHHDHEEEPHGREGLQPEVTALLIRYRNAAAALRLPSMINRQTEMQAASPATESARFIALFGAAFEGAKLFGWLLAATGGLAIFVALLGMARSREGDLALLRVMGANRLQLFATILFEGLITSGAGAMLGLLVTHGLMVLAQSAFPAIAEMGISPFRLLPMEAGIVIAMLAIGALAALIPAICVYRGNLSNLLASL